MRPTALLALLPLLATAASAHDHDAPPSSRKSLNFGPHYPHKVYESFPATSHLKLRRDGDARGVAAAFIADKVGKEGEAFYIRDDTYTDPRTLVTHVYARQLVNGLEVSDGNINVNVDRDGRVISYGNSFAASAAPTIEAYDRAAFCRDRHAWKAEVEDSIHDTESEATPWSFLKEAAKTWLGIDFEDAPVEADRVLKNQEILERLNHKLQALCANPDDNREHLSATEALSHLLSVVSPSFVTPDDLTSTVEHSFKPKPAHAEPPTEIISGDALAAADVVNPVPARLVWTQTPKEIRPVYKFEVEMKDNWYEAYVDLYTGEVHRIVDWAADAPASHFSKKKKGGKGDKQKPFPSPGEPETAEYSVFPWGVNDPTTGKVELVTDPWDKVASPLGWHSFPTKANPWPQAHFDGATTKGNQTTVASTVGNNVLAHEDWEGRNNFLANHRPVNKSMSFVYEYGEPDGLAPKEYVDFAITQLFYTCNAYHDLLYRLGFDEVSGNFQMYNFDKGGRGGDPVIANAQDGSGYNNANFMTPPDGQAPRMRMYVWDTATPYRDGDLEAGIVIHEYSHGLSTRLTGGPADSSCLGWGEAGGMGEGWGDAIATIIRQVHEHKQFDNGTDVFPMGAWAANQAGGIRNYVYTTNSTVNPSTYKTLDKPGYWGVHAIGEVWAEILFVMNQRLIAKHGFSSTLYPPEDTSKPNDYYTETSDESVDDLGRPKPLIPKHGNTLALQLIISAMKLQPCRPSFFDARDAIVQADHVLTGGANACDIWKAFAERGLGSDAEIIGQTPWGGGVRKDGFKVPKC